MIISWQEEKQQRIAKLQKIKKKLNSLSMKDDDYIASPSKIKISVIDQKLVENDGYMRLEVCFFLLINQ